MDQIKDHHTPPEDGVGLICMSPALANYLKRRTRNPSIPVMRRQMAAMTVEAYRLGAITSRQYQACMDRLLERTDDTL